VFIVACSADVDHCLHDGKEVLLSYGYDINRFNMDIIILGAFYVVSYMLGYYGLLRRTKKQPAYWTKTDIDNFVFTVKYR